MKAETVVTELLRYMLKKTNKTNNNNNKNIHVHYLKCSKEQKQKWVTKCNNADSSGCSNVSSLQYCCIQWKVAYNSNSLHLKKYTSKFIEWERLESCEGLLVCNKTLCHLFCCRWEKAPHSQWVCPGCETSACTGEN